MLIFEGQSYSHHQFMNEFTDSSEVYLSDISDVLNRWYDANDFIKLTSSGSTAQAKTITLKKSSIKESALRTQNYFKYKAGDKALLCLPVKFIGGMMMVIRSIVSDLNLHITAPSLSPIADLSTPIEFVPMTPSQLSSSLSINPNATNNIKSILLGGGSVNTSLLEKIQELGSAVYHSYGMTETISHVAIRQLNKDNATDYFVTLDGIEIHVNEESCLDISSNYFEEVVYTNDIVELIAHNKFIWKGRKDNVINTGGVKVYPEIVEQKMDKILSNSFFIIGSPDAILGEKVCLVIESDCGIDPKTIKNQLSVVLDKFEIPKDIYILSEFLRTPTEKIRRKDTFEKAIKKQYISS